jgi:hypothetical protein
MKVAAQGELGADVTIIETKCRPAQLDRLRRRRFAARWAVRRGDEMTGHAASAYLREPHAIRRTAATLAKLRCVGGGPPFRKVG